MNKIDSLAEELGTVYQLIESIQKFNKEQYGILGNENIIVLSEYTLAYLDNCFNILLEIDPKK